MRIRIITAILITIITTILITLIVIKIKMKIITAIKKNTMIIILVRRTFIYIYILFLEIYMIKLIYV